MDEGMTSLEEQGMLRNRLSLWRQLAIGTWLAQAALIGMWVLGQSSLPQYAYTPWENGPKMVFDREVDCWRHLALAKKTNSFLLNQDCVREK